MRKTIAFIIRWGGFIAGFYFFSQFIQYLTGASDVADRVPYILKNAILMGVCFLTGGCGKRIYNINEGDIEEDGLASCILSRIFCRRLFNGILIYFGMTALSYTLHWFMEDQFEWGWGIAGFFCFVGGIMALKYSCKCCGRSLVMHGSNYDDDVTIDVTETSATAYRYSDDYYHCPRCGWRTTIRTKNTVGKVNYK